MFFYHYCCYSSPCYCSTELSLYQPTRFSFSLSPPCFPHLPALAGGKEGWASGCVVPTAGGVKPWPNTTWMGFLSRVSPYSCPFPQSGSAHLGCTGTTYVTGFFCSMVWMFRGVSELACGWLNLAKSFLDVCSLLVRPSCDTNVCALVEEDSGGTEQEPESLQRAQ